MESILTSVKKMLGIDEEDKHFDSDIVMHINSVFMTLTQLGVGPSEGFAIEDDLSSWTDFITNNSMIEAVKSYTYMKVKLMFDSHSMSSSVIESYSRMISEYEWRINHAVEMSKSNQT